MEPHVSIQILERVEELEWEALEAIFHKVGWKNHTKERIKPAFQNSAWVAIATVEGRIVGFGRVVSDRIFYAAIYDMVIDPDFQHRGIGRKIMEALLKRVEKLPFVHLTSTLGNEPFYRKLGLKKHKTAMARYLNSEMADMYLE